MGDPAAVGEDIGIFDTDGKCSLYGSAIPGNCRCPPEEEVTITASSTAATLASKKAQLRKLTARLASHEILQ